jgi:hypothetical protein
VRQRESRASTQGDGEPKECRELLHASPEFQDFLLEFRCPQVRHVQAYHDLRSLAESPAGRRTRDPEIRGEGHVPGALDEIPKPVVVALLKPPRGRHGDDHPAFAYAAQLLKDIAAVRRRETVRRSDDNSRRREQNVGGDSPAAGVTLAPTPLTFPGEEIPRDGVRVVPVLARRVDGIYVKWASYRVRTAARRRRAASPGTATSQSPICARRHLSQLFGTMSVRWSWGRSLTGIKVAAALTDILRHRPRPQAITAH